MTQNPSLRCIPKPSYRLMPIPLLNRAWSRHGRFADNFDGTLQEPVTLPAVCRISCSTAQPALRSVWQPISRHITCLKWSKAALHRLKTHDDGKELAKYIPAPDLPTKQKSSPPEDLLQLYKRVVVAS